MQSGKQQSPLSLPALTSAWTASSAADRGAGRTRANDRSCVAEVLELELGRHSHTRFTNPDFVNYAESFGARGHYIKAAGELLPTLRRALDDDGVSVVACPVNYSENLCPDRPARRAPRPLPTLTLLPVPQQLNERQLQVLRWVGQGCPEGVWEGTTHKLSCQALQSRGLVKVSKRKGQWSASLTNSRPRARNAISLLSEPPQRVSRHGRPCHGHGRPWQRPVKFPQCRASVAGPSILRELQDQRGDDPSERASNVRRICVKISPVTPTMHST